MDRSSKRNETGLVFGQVGEFPFRSSIPAQPGGVQIRVVGINNFGSGGIPVQRMVMLLMAELEQPDSMIRNSPLALEQFEKSLVNVLLSGQKHNYSVDFEKFGDCTSPMAFVQSRRLIKVRRVLLAPRPRTTVTEAALLAGFSSFNRFSILYKKTFGETPSQMLNRGREKRISKHHNPSISW